MNITRRGSILALLLAALPLCAQDIQVIEKNLSNGMRLLMVERHDQPTIAAGWVARVGSVNERPGITGIAHMLEHMMFKGTTHIGTRDAKRDAELNARQDALQVQIREEQAILREKFQRGEIKDVTDPAARTPRLKQLLAEFDGLVKEQRQIVVKDEMDKIYNQAGATGLNASTSRDRTFYIITIPSNKLELWAWLESDRLLQPVFREFYSERDVIREERRQTLESRPDGKVQEAFNAMIWMASPYRWQVIGWPSDITQMKREDASDCFATFYAPGNLTAILVGDFNPDQASALAEKYFGRIPMNPKGVPDVTTLEPPQPAEQRMVAEIESTPSIEVYYKAVPKVHKDVPALQVLASILNGSGSGNTGRFKKALVLGQAVATRASASFQGLRYGGVFSLSATPTAKSSPEAVEPLLYAEVEKIAREGVTEQELRRAKKAFQVANYQRLESNTGLRDALANAIATGRYQDLLETQKHLQAVTGEDVQRVAKAYLVKDNRNVLITHRKAQESH